MQKTKSTVLIMAALMATLVLVPSLAEATNGAAAPTVLFGDVITTQVGEVLILGIVSGFFISLISKWASGSAWNHTQFAYTWALSTFTAFGVLSKVTLSSDNFILTLLAIFGGAFVANKSVQAAQRLKAKSVPKTP